MHVFLNRIGCCSLVLLLDASLVVGCIFFVIALVAVALCSCWMPAWSLDACFSITLVVVAVRSCWMPEWSFHKCSLNDDGRCGLVFLLDASLVVGCIFFLITLVVVALCSGWMPAWCLDALLS